MMKRLFALALALSPLACGGSSGPSNADQFCSQTESIACDKAFECVPVAARDPTFTDTFGASVADCKAKVATDCVGAAAGCPSYNASAGGSCVNALSAATCADFGGGLPASCDTACPGST